MSSPGIEPVPAATQLLVRPFLAAVGGALSNGSSPSLRLRLTLHRRLVRAKLGYFQQLADYFGTAGTKKQGVGRIFPVSTGIIGAAYRTKEIWRTRHFPTRELFLEAKQRDIEKDMRETRDINQIPDSYLAVPFIGSNNSPTAVLYCECFEYNFFADDARSSMVNAMCVGFAELLDTLITEADAEIRNFPISEGDDVIEEKTVYEELQEQVSALAPPKLHGLNYLNFEAASV